MKKKISEPCPICNAHQSYYRKRTEDYTCKNCGYIWIKMTPQILEQVYKMYKTNNPGISDKEADLLSKAYLGQKEKESQIKTRKILKDQKMNLVR